ncbi:glycosyltransferase family 2 protein [Alkalibacillus almallahensis]|uniref:glycosyltransferase family 2 protein n=1 Tax=Alkalibacillus almallahensis TaxID=1379154 RepID=UPI00141E609C|nr:glycosyltransferase family 2 protein [Alkalibacillus almallahensis]NIK11816.1 glycosyltransferase involved in cell wall biosynthesis [Alkalibacillus almallahensis]
MKKQLFKLFDSVIFSRMSDEKRKKLSGMLSERQKKMLKRYFGRSQNEKDKKQVDEIKYKLYNLGFYDKALEDLQDIYLNDEGSITKRKKAAWELALWHANNYTANEAKKAIKYLRFYVKNHSNVDDLRKVAILMSECLDILDEQDRANEILDRVLSYQEHPDLYLAKSNLMSNIDEKIVWINKAYKHYDLEPITFRNTENEVSYEQLDMKNPSIPSKNTDVKVSIILPSYNAEEGIQTAIESMQKQTWTNIEIIVVDDCSQDETKEIVNRLKEEDSRIKLYTTGENSGPYVARNIGLQKSTGDLVTVNDADDWSHAEKIELQARHLIDNPEMVANSSEHARLTENLKFYRRGLPGRYIFSNMSSIMFRKAEVINTIGFWDSVRFAADGEFKRRLVNAFGNNRVKDLNTGPLSLPKQAVASLTGNSAFGYNGYFKGIRKEYVEALERYHSSGNLYMPFPLNERPYSVPEPLWLTKDTKEQGFRYFDVIIASDFTDESKKLDEEVKDWLKHYEKVGLVQLHSYENARKSGKVCDNIREILDGKRIQFVVYGEFLECSHLIIIDDQLLKYKQEYLPNIISNETTIKSDKHSTKIYRAISELKANELFNTSRDN